MAAVQLMVKKIRWHRPTDPSNDVKHPDTDKDGVTDATEKSDGTDPTKSILMEMASMMALRNRTGPTQLSLIQLAMATDGTENQMALILIRLIRMVTV